MTKDGTSVHPAWSPDGEALTYVSKRDGAQAIWKQRLTDGTPAGNPVKVTVGWPRFTTFPVWSPDGSTIAFLTLGKGDVQDVAVVSSTGGSPRVITSGADAVRVRWEPRTGNLLVAGHWGTDHYELRTISPAGVPVRAERAPIVLGKEASDAMFDVSPDGQFIVAARGRRAAQVWVMEAKSGVF